MCRIDRPGELGFFSEVLVQFDVGVAPEETPDGRVIGMVAVEPP
jgi:hypothetical protein